MLTIPLERKINSVSGSDKAWCVCVWMRFGDGMTSTNLAAVLRRNRTDAGRATGQRDLEVANVMVGSMICKWSPDTHRNGWPFYGSQAFREMTSTWLTVLL